MSEDQHRIEAFSRGRRIAEVFSVAIAFAVSIVSLWFAWQANRQSIIQSRPYLVIDLVRIDSGPYLLAERQGSNIVMTAKVKLKNLGTTPAVNVTLADSIVTGRRVNNEPITQPVVEKPYPASLTANSTFEVLMEYSHPVDGVSSDYIEKVQSGQLGLDIRMDVKYQGVGMKDKTYTSHWSGEVFSDRRLLISTIFK